MICGEWKLAGGDRQSPLLVRFRAASHVNSIDVPGMCGSQIGCAISPPMILELQQAQPRLVELCRRHNVRRLEIFGSATGEQAAAV